MKRVLIATLSTVMALGMAGCATQEVITEATKAPESSDARRLRRQHDPDRRDARLFPRPEIIGRRHQGRPEPCAESAGRAGKIKQNKGF